MEKYFNSSEGNIRLTPSKKYIKLGIYRYALVSDIIKQLKNKIGIYGHVRVYNNCDMILEDKYPFGKDTYGYFIDCKNFTNDDIKNFLKMYKSK